MTKRKCLDCGADISDRRSYAKRCVSCSGARRKKQIQAYREAHRKEYQPRATQLHREWIARHPDYLTKYNREYRIKNRDAIVKREKEWLKTPRGREVNLIKCSKRRARQVGAEGGFSDKDVRKLKGIYSACVYCGKRTGLQVDHVISLDVGGRNDITNLVLACKACNSGKRVTTLEEWFKRYPEKKAHFYKIVRKKVVRNKKTGKRRILYLPKAGSKKR